MRYLTKYKLFEGPDYTSDQISNAVDDIIYIIQEILSEEYIEEWDRTGYPNDIENFWKRKVTTYKNIVIDDGVCIYTKSISKHKRILSGIKKEKHNIERYINMNLSIEDKVEEIPLGSGNKYLCTDIQINWKNLSDRVNDVKRFFSFIIKGGEV
jgi:hypothetical protein